MSAQQPEVLVLEGNFGRREMEAEKKRMAEAVERAEKKAEMFRKARAPLRGSNVGLEQQEMFGEKSLFNPMKRKRKTKRTTTRRTKHAKRRVCVNRCTETFNPRRKRKRRAAPRRSARRRSHGPPRRKRRAPTAAKTFYHAIRRAGHVDIYRVSGGKPKFVSCIKPSKLRGWAAKRGITIK